MTIDDLFRVVLKYIPNASFDTDNEGQVIIYTNKKEKSDGTLVELDD